jgi:ribosomal protein L24
VCDQVTRVGYSFQDDGRKVRVCRKCQGQIGNE